MKENFAGTCKSMLGNIEKQVPAGRMALGSVNIHSRRLASLPPSCDDRRPNLLQCERSLAAGVPNWRLRHGAGALAPN